MRFGYFSQLQMPKPWRGEGAEQQLYWDAIDEAVHAEAVGFDYYWQTEHHFYSEIGHSSAPEVFLGALAQRTHTIRLGYGVVVLPCNHPYRVVEQAATLDILSRGRVELGTGRGTSWYHTEAFGVQDAESRAVWKESLEVICSMFLNDRFPGHQGTYYQLPERTLLPKPVQKPHPPLWVAASQASSFEGAAKMGLGVLGLTAQPPEKLTEAIQAYRAAQRHATPVGGYANHQIAAFSLCYVDEDDRRGRDLACASARWYLGDNDAELQWVRFNVPKTGPLSPDNEEIQSAARDRLHVLRTRSNDEMIDSGMVIGGNPDTVCRVVEKWANAGVDQIMLMIQGTYKSHDQVMRAQELLGTHVIPKFRNSSDPAPGPPPVAAEVAPAVPIGSGGG